MQILVSIGTVGASPQIEEILPPCDFFLTVMSLPFFSRSYAQVEPLDRFSRFISQTTCFHARMDLLGVRTMGDHIWGNMPPKLPKNWREQFPAKTVKYENRNISKTINRIKTKFEDQAETGNCTSWVVQYYPDQIQYGCRRPS